VRNSLVRRRAAVVLAAAVAVVGLAMSTAPAALADHQPEPGGSVSVSGIVNSAQNNVGKKACSTNSRGGTGFYTSCTGNGGSPEYWCADFAKWVWAKNGVDVANLTAAAASFYGYATDRYTTTPAVGDAVLFSREKKGSGGLDDIHHVAIVVAVSASKITTISGDWGGSGPSEADFAGSSHVVNNGTFSGDVNTHPAAIDRYIVGYEVP
jgi:hypothetical protein